MKKALSLALTLCMVLSLFATFVVSASADEVVTWEDGIINDPADTKPEDGQNLKFSNAYGYKFAIDADNKIGGEDNVVIKDQATYEACNPNWAITVQLIPAGDYYVAGLVVPTPGSAAKAIEAGINFDNGNIVLVAHSSYSYDPGEGKGQNYTGKLAALALKEGDKVQVSDTEVYVLIPGVDDKPAAPVKGENIALGKEYTTSEQFRQGGAPDWGYDPNAAIAYPDEKGSLTDGAVNPTDTDSKTCYQDVVWAGFSHLVPSYAGYNHVTIDLGATKALYEVAIYFGTSFLGNGIGVSNSEVQFFASNDNATWTEISEKIAIVDDANATTTKVSAEVTASARYVQVRFVREGWLFVSEVEVYEAVGGVQTVKEEITVDGDVTDTGWAKDGWVEVSGDNGFWQNPLPWQVENGVYPDLAYKYQVRADETKLYVAVEVNCDLVEGGNGNGTNVRFWINTNDEATVYTHFYDVFKKDGAIAYNAKYNKSTTANDGGVIENSTIAPAITSANGKTYVEFSVDLAEFNGEEGFNYFICVSNNPVGDDTPNVCLYYPAMPIGPVTDTHDGPNHIPYQNLPYVTWHRATQATVVVEDILLGEVVVDNGSNDEEVKEEADTSMMGTAPAAPKFSVTLNGPEAWVAGEKVKIDVVIEVLEDELALNQILFNLFFDAADVEITLPEDDFSALVTAAPADSWKGENAMFALSTVDGYGLISGGVGSEKETDSLKKGDKVVVSFEFTVKADAKGLINFQLSNEELVGYTYADPATAIAGAGSNLAIAEKTDDLGDAGIYAIAALAIVALIGTAVVIKRRA